jgi:hypothetical protein
MSGFDILELSSVPHQTPFNSSASHPAGELHLARPKAVLIAKPWDNFSIAGGIKNAIDWVGKAPRSTVTPKARRDLWLLQVRRRFHARAIDCGLRHSSVDPKPKGDSLNCISLDPDG